MPEEPLWIGPQPQAAPAPLPPQAPAATRAGDDNCTIAAEPKSPAQEAENFPQKSCETPAAESGKVLWNSGQAGEEQAPLASCVAAATCPPSETCGTGNERKPPAQVSLAAPKKSCEAALEELPLSRLRQRRDETVLLSDRRRDRKARQKQLARWQAARACKAG